MTRALAIWSRRLTLARTAIAAASWFGGVGLHALGTAVYAWFVASGAAAADDAAGLVYKAEAGPLKVQSVQRLVLKDAKRNKELELRISFPSGQGPFPVIVWSHGAGGSKDNYSPLVEHWAS